MAYVQDGGNQWPATVERVGGAHVVVRMAGANGFNGVTSGPARNGQVIDNQQNAYSVSLPGLTQQAETFTVAFDRVLVGAHA